MGQKLPSRHFRGVRRPNRLIPGLTGLGGSKPAWEAYPGDTPKKPSFQECKINSYRTSAENEPALTKFRPSGSSKPLVWAYPAYRPNPAGLPGLPGLDVWEQVWRGLAGSCQTAPNLLSWTLSWEGGLGAGLAGSRDPAKPAPNRPSGIGSRMGVWGAGLARFGGYPQNRPNRPSQDPIRTLSG